MALVLVVLTSSNALAAEAPVGKGLLATLRTARPEVRWDASTLVVADLNGDGRPDAAAVGYSKSGIVLAVGVSNGKGALTIQYLDFPISASIQAAICGAPAHLSAVPLSCSSDGNTLPGCREASNTAGLSLSGGACDPINLYWNYDEHRIVWWRN
jgi:hypothetical protein